MSDEIWLPLIVAAIIAITSVVSFFGIRFLDRRMPIKYSLPKIIVAGIFPSILIVAILAVWHYFEYQAYLRGPREGFMGPLLLLIYGFPYFIINLLCNLFVAGYFRWQSK